MGAERLNAWWCIKSTHYKDDEVEGCFDALHACANIDLIQVQQDVGWRGILIEQPEVGVKKGTPSNYPAHRGTSIQLDGKPPYSGRKATRQALSAERISTKRGKAFHRLFCFDDLLVMGHGMAKPKLSWD